MQAYVPFAGVVFYTLAFAKSPVNGQWHESNNGSKN